MKKLLGYGLVAVIALAVVGAIIGGGTEDSGVAPDSSEPVAEATSSSEPAATPQADGPAEAELGEPITIEGVEVTIKDVKWSEGGEFLKPASGYVWVGYNIQLKALDDNRFVSSGDWTALADGNQQGSWTIGGEESWKPLLSFDELRAGATTSGWVVFEVPKPKDYVRLVYDPDFFSDEARLTFDATLD